VDFHPILVPKIRLPLYILSIRAPLPPYLPVETFIFPLSPSAVRKTAVSLTAFYDTPGPPSLNGVQRNVDNYGLTPFTYEIEGTTGWDRHMTDGYLYTGLQAFQRLQRMFQNYAQFNQSQRTLGQSQLYFMEFADFFNGEFYRVEPFGPMEFTQSERAPLLQFYRLRLLGLFPIGSPLENALVSDALALLFSLPVPTAVQKAILIGNAVAATYGPALTILGAG
jgi:hypothetical protein